MEKKSAEKQTMSLTSRSEAVSASEKGEPLTARDKFNSFLSRVLYKLGFETDFSSGKKEKIPVKQLPRRAWNGVKSAASDTRDIWLNKSAAYDKPLFVIVIVLVVVGLVMMSSASYAYSYSHYGNSMKIINKQVIATIIGIIFIECET